MGKPTVLEGARREAAREALAPEQRLRLELLPGGNEQMVSILRGIEERHRHRPYLSLVRQDRAGATWGRDPVG